MDCTTNNTADVYKARTFRSSSADMNWLPLLQLLFAFASAGNILLFNPSFGHSHVRFLGNLADMYAKDGHNVTILSPIIDDSFPPHGTNNPNITKIAFHSPFLNLDFWQKINMKNPSFWDLPEMDGMSFELEEWTIFMEVLELTYRGLLEDKALLQSLRDSKFNLGIAEYFELGAVGIFDILNIDTAICAAALGWIETHYDITGMPQFNSFIPSYVTTFGTEMTFWERFLNSKALYDTRKHNEYWQGRLEKIFWEYYPQMEGLSALAAKKTGIILSNANEFTESPRPTLNMVKYIGGANVHPPKPLDSEISSLLDLRPSTVLFSFGTFIKGCQIPLDMKMDILEAFSAFPEVTFLWKYEDCENDTTPFGLYPNVIPKAWWPQTDLLGDERLKAFITHAGMNSMLEVAFRGKPAITVPLFADQYINAKASASIGMSIMIKRTELNKENLIGALHKVLDDESEIAKKARMAAAVLEGKDDEYRKEALRWARLLMEFGPMEHLRLPSRNLNVFQLYCIDIFLFLAAIPILSSIFLFYGFKFLRRIMSKSKQKKL